MVRCRPSFGSVRPLRQNIKIRLLLRWESMAPGMGPWLLLLLREHIQIRELYLLDIDGEALRIAKKLLALWDFNRKLNIHYIQEDCGETHFAETCRPDLIINTSCEHFKNYDWFKNLPSGIDFAIQSTDMVHPTHINGVRSLEEFKTQLPGDFKISLEDVLEIRYPHFQFSRYFLMGQKTSS